MAFSVVNIISADTIEVTGWDWEGRQGRFVKIADYTVKETYNSFIQAKLISLLSNQVVDLRNPIKIEPGAGEHNDILFCSVYLNDVNIAQYFPELKDKESSNSKLSSLLAFLF